MPTTPLYRRGESVYLRSSAEIGKLDSFKITSIRQVQSGRWIYEISISKKPPHHALIGDSYDSRINERSIFYAESELITICEALDIVVNNFQRQITTLENQIDSKCSDYGGEPIPGVDEPRWAIDDIVYYDASARLGFLEKTKITDIYEVGIQPGSKRTRYRYKVRTKNPRITFREDELISYCEAAAKALISLQADHDAAVAKQSTLCQT